MIRNFRNRPFITQGGSIRRMQTIENAYEDYEASLSPTDLPSLMQPICLPFLKLPLLLTSSDNVEEVPNAWSGIENILLSRQWPNTFLDFIFFYKIPNCMA